MLLLGMLRLRQMLLPGRRVSRASGVLLMVFASEGVIMVAEFY